MSATDPQSNLKEPLISVITPVLNRADTIEEAIKSVIAQNYPKVEHIVIDGGSTDGTLNVLKKYPHLRVTSEPDKGMYDAINKGIRRAKGEIIGILNSDDIYTENVFDEIAKHFIKDPDLRTACGGSVVFEELENEQRRIVVSYTDEKYKKLSYETAMMDGGTINGRFFHRSVYRDIGVYDTQYRITSDRDFLIRAVIAKLKEVRIPQTTYWYRRHPNSLTFAEHPTHALEMQEEMLKMLKHYMQDSSVPPATRRHAKISHSRRSSRMFVYLLQQGQPLKSVSYVMRGWRNNLAWPLIFLWQISRVLGNWIRSLPILVISAKKKNDS